MGSSSSREKDTNKPEVITKASRERVGQKLKGKRKEKWPAIGIDLGTMYSCVGAWHQNRIEIIPNDQGSRTTPSWVAFTDTERLIGEAAENQGRMNPTNTIFDAKRLIGRIFFDETVQDDIKSWPFEVIPCPNSNEDEKPLVVVSFMGEKRQFSAEEISAMVLVKIKGTAEAFLGMPVKNAVVTVPAYFNDSQRQATKDAGSIAGLNVVRIINEPTAAAIAYGFNKNLTGDNASKKNVLVFDLGGGTFDVSLVSTKNDIFEVKAVGGHTHLGGSDFDNRMVNYFVEQFKKKHGKDLSQCPRAIGRLRASCEKAKRALSATTQTTIELDYLYDGIDFSSTISRARFDNLNVDLFKTCINIVKQCLRDGGISKSKVDDILLVGGSTRIPKIQELIQEFFDGKEPSRRLNPDEAVAYGAAVYAAVLCGVTTNNNMVLVDVNPLSLGVKVGNGRTGIMSVVIPKNTTIPTKEEKSFAVQRVENRKYGDVDDNCSSYTLEIYEGDGHRAEENNFLGVLELNGIPPSTEGHPNLITVCFEIDVNGILRVSAEDQSSGIKSKVKIINRSRLTKEEVDRMVNEAEEYKAQDKKYEQMVKAKNKLEEFTIRVRHFIKRNDNSISVKEKTAISAALEPVLELLDSSAGEVHDAEKYEEKMQQLQLLCEPFISMMY